jgi:hypothetical protein
MAEDIIEQVEPHIREILRICRAVNVEGRELHELNALVGRTSKLTSVHLCTSSLKLRQFKIILSN